MMNAHAFARQLLNGPDIPIGLPVSVDSEYYEICEPIIEQEMGEHPFSGEAQDVLIITRKRRFKMRSRK